MKALQTAVEKLRTAKEGPEKEAATKEVMQQLEKSFTSDLERREQEVSEIESRVKKLRDQIEKRKKAKDEIISLRLKTIINETQGLGFPGPAGPVGFEHGEMLPGQMGGIGWAFPHGPNPDSGIPRADQPEQP
jgi:chromosome segregation ATPase